MIETSLLALAGTCILLLLGIIGYFLKQLHSVIIGLDGTVKTLHLSLTQVTEEGKGKNALVQSKLRELDRRLTKLEG